jgi:hypothetical protein
MINDRDRDTDHAALDGVGELRNLTARQFGALRWDPFIEYVVLEVTGNGSEDQA